MSLTLNQKLELIKFSEENMSKAKRLSFPGGSVIRNQPANAGTWVCSLIQGDPTCCGVAKPVLQSLGAIITEPMGHNY